MLYISSSYSSTIITLLTIFTLTPHSIVGQLVEDRFNLTAHPSLTPHLVLYHQADFSTTDQNDQRLLLALVNMYGEVMVKVDYAELAAYVIPPPSYSPLHKSSH